MVDKVDDNHNEVLRGAAEENVDDYKYDLRSKITNEVELKNAIKNQEQLVVNLRSMAETLQEIKELLQAIVE